MEIKDATKLNQTRAWLRIRNSYAMVIGLFLISLGVGFGCTKPQHRAASSQTEEVCFNSLERMPIHWHPSLPLKENLSNLPWRAEETSLAKESVSVALDEMITYQAQYPETVVDLWDNSVEAYIDAAYAGTNHPELTNRALAVAHKHLRILWHPYAIKEQALETCDDTSTALTLLIYAHNLWSMQPQVESSKAIKKALLPITNRLLSACGKLERLLGYKYTQSLAAANAPNGAVYDMVMWAIMFIDALRIEGLNLPAETGDFIKSLWRYLGTYPTPQAITFTGGANNHTFYDLAYLFTHIGYIPTGYGRHALHRQDGEWLYQFIRSNFYAVMEMGELDLFAEFVDLLRQYGCSESNDKQTRDGARYLLSLYTKAGHSWINHRESYESKASNPYDLLHKPWTAMAGLRIRAFEACTPNSYCDVFRKLTKPAP